MTMSYDITGQAKTLEHKEISIKKRRDQKVPAEKPSEIRLDTIRVGLSYHYLCLQVLEQVGLLVGVGCMCLPS
jgi:hypothetical protein